MPAVRPAAVAGSFYPRDAAALAAEISRYLGAVASASSAPVPKAIIAPHAGYVYSGPVAASIYAQLAPLRGRITRVVLAGPAHRVYVTGAAIPSSTAFASPLGDVPLDHDALARIAELPFVETNDRAHALEHSLEVHVPFLQSVLGTFSLVPVVVGDAEPEQMARLLETLWGGNETLIVVSSDLSHYLPYEAAQERDARTAESIVALDARIDPDEACGAYPINGLLALARRLGLAARLVDLRNSGDTAGPRDQVVGYGAFTFHEGARARG